MHPDDHQQTLCIMYGDMQGVTQKQSLHVEAETINELIETALKAPLFEGSTMN